MKCFFLASFFCLISLCQSGAPSDEDDNGRAVRRISQQDFAFGTFRITQPGEYHFAEDITFDPNPGTRNEPGAWLPHYPEQENEYPRMPYSLGFFAAITIETADVTLDLRGHTLQSSQAFYLQQRFCALITLSSAPFIPNQGPGNFGPSIVSASNCVVRNGVIGLSSHHGIAGNNITGCVLEDLTIENFEVGAISVNGVRDFIIRRVVARNSITFVPVDGSYTGARFMLGFLRAFSNADLDGKRVVFNDGRNMTLRNILDRLEYAMDLVFRNYIDGNESVLADPEWGQFVNPSGLPDCSVIYGIVVNGIGVAVNGFGRAPITSSNVELHHVTISNLAVKPKEIVTYAEIIGGNPVPAIGGTGDAFEIVRLASNGMTDPASAVYVGTRLSDAQIAFSLHAAACGVFIPKTFFIPPTLQQWATNGTSLVPGTFELFCNGDTQFHVIKGAIGLRIDATTTFELNHVYVDNVVNTGDYGSLLCGEYTVGVLGAHPLQTLEGYGGTRSLGMSIFTSSGEIFQSDVSSISSVLGVASGIQIADSAVNFKGKNDIVDITANAVNSPPGQSGGFPNPIPQGCGVRVLGQTTTVTGRSKAVRVKCVTGLELCAPGGSMFGVVQGC